MQVQPVVLEGRHVRLLPLAEEHAEQLAESATAELLRYSFPPAELTAQGFRDQIRGLRSLTSWCPFAQVLRSDGQVVGMTCYLDIQPANRSLEIGSTWIGERWQGTAVNPEAKLLLLRHAFDTLGAVRVQLKCDARNVQSQRAIEKLGAVREGVLRRHMTLPDCFVRDTVMYSVIDSEWPALRDALEQRVAAT